MKDYRQLAQKEREAHKKALLEEFDLVNNPKASRCYEIAWDYGHSVGFHEVRNYFIDLIDLIR